MSAEFQQIACIGECMVEFFDRGEGCWQRGFAGDSLNVAWALRALLPADWQVEYVTRVGQDNVSEDMLTFIREAGLGVSGVSRDPERTVGLYTIKTDEHGERSFDYWRSFSAARLLADDAERLQQNLSAAGWVYLSGISAAIIGERGRANLLTVLMALREAGVKVAYDPNYRPKLWGDKAAMQRFSQQIVGLSAVVLPTFEDEQAGFGDTSPQASITRLLDWGAPLVVVKNGIEPTLTGTQDGITAWPLTSPQHPVDTTGAGDSFNGGFLAAFIQNQPLSVSIASGQRIAAKVVTQRGALLAYEKLQDTTVQTHYPTAAG